MARGYQDVNEPTASLRRTISGPLLVFYGVGTMLGAGIYALIGEVAGSAGIYAPAAFAIAAVIAGLTATSFAEFSSRYPKSAGEAVYVSAGFANTNLALVVGLLIVASGIVSSGVMFRGFIGYAATFTSFPDWAGFLALAFVVCGLAAWGIAQSLVVVAVITIVETGVLLLVIAAGFTAEAALPSAAAPSWGIASVFSGAVLAFYAFIGFEDMVNIAEEVKNPRRTMPRAIFFAFAVTTLIYVAIAWVAVRTTPIDALAQSEAPMALIFSRVSSFPVLWISLIAMVAIVNGALVQVVMASRVLYGLARQKLLPEWFGRINRRTRTPVLSTIFIAACVFSSASLLPLDTLARATTLFLLIVFTLVNLALIRVKLKDPHRADGFEAPLIIPWLGAASAAAFAVFSAIEIIR